KRARLPLCQQAVVTARLENAPGQLAAAAAKLANAKVNINYVYGSVGAPNQPGLMVFGVDDVAKAAKVLS
ncbi:MAG: hypothetical protein ACE5K7_07685, partial [Phycisphaerae bacterium]